MQGVEPEGEGSGVWHPLAVAHGGSSQSLFSLHCAPCVRLSHSLNRRPRAPRPQAPPPPRPAARRRPAPRCVGRCVDAGGLVVAGDDAGLGLASLRIPCPRHFRAHVDLVAAAARGCKRWEAWRLRRCPER
jgi:hypothetical protein